MADFYTDGSHDTSTVNGVGGWAWVRVDTINDLAVYTEHASGRIKLMSVLNLDARSMEIRAIQMAIFSCPPKSSCRIFCDEQNVVNLFYAESITDERCEAIQKIRQYARLYRIDFFVQWNKRNSSVYAGYADHLAKSARKDGTPIAFEYYAEQYYQQR